MGFWKNLVASFVPAGSSAEESLDWEAILMQADLGVTLALRLVKELEKRKLTRKNAEAEAFLRTELERLVQTERPMLSVDKPEVVLLVGVNGSGKTTTTAKLAKRILGFNQTVVLGAADTFRAAAVEQLQLWGTRLGVEVVHGAEGTDPASVAFRSFETAVERKADWLLVDTAGRLANKHNLMLEIAKVKRVLGKKNPQAPHHTWLVVDGTTGVNILSQAKEFHQACGLTGLIVTKLDGSAKGGMIAAVREELGLPTFFLGRGEQATDLEEFDGKKFVEDFFS
jgi:fused signal recognition particle receptor